MREIDYINATNYARLSTIRGLLRDLEFSDPILDEDVRFFGQWLVSMQLNISIRMEIKPDKP